MFGKKKRDANQADSSATTSSKENPYIAHIGTSDDRYMNLAIDKRNWQVAWRITAGILAVSVGFNGFYMFQNKFIPYVIEKDKLGHIISVGVPTRANPIDDKRVIRGQMEDWVENARTVIGDQLYQKKLIKQVYARVPESSAAKKVLDEFYRGRKPSDVAKSETIEVKVDVSLPSGNTWDVEWTETHRNLQGEVIGQPELWKGRFTQTISPQDTEDGIKGNPAGFFITNFSWSKKR